jgi:hypothetical protein
MGGVLAIDDPFAGAVPTPLHAAVGAR